MLHRHRSLELYRVEDGELAFYLEDANGEVVRRAIGAGGVAFIPGGAEHTVRNESEAAARAFVVLAPGGELETFARSVAELDGVSPDDVIRLAGRSGIEITRPVEEAVRA